MQNNGRRATAKTVGLLTAIALGAGALTAAAVAPVAGAIGVASRDAAQTFNGLKVPRLSLLPIRSRIVDRSGRLIAYYYPNSIYRIPVSYSKISPDMRNAIVAIEDNRFFERSGAFDLRATIRAIISTLAGHQVQGGSTLSQQYIKNALELTLPTKAQRLAAATSDVGVKGIGRKIRELRMAAVVEHQLTKRQLLAAYLNAVPFSNNATGIQVAAETYFSTTAAQLNLTQSALLAGIVNSPSADDPFVYKSAALSRRNEVLQAMLQQHYISTATYAAAVAAPLGLHPSSAPIQQGCTSNSARQAAFFCDYVLALIARDPAYKQAEFYLTHIGGLTIQTTMDPQDQHAAEHAVMYMVPPPPSYYNPSGLAAAEVLIQPGTGYVRAIAVDRRYAQSGAGASELNLAVDERYHGSVGVQTGSSSKIFTLITALKQGIPFGTTIKVHNGMTVSGFTNCKGDHLNPFQVFNADPGENAGYNLYNGTTASVNAFYVNLEARVGLCNVVRTAASMGLHRGDGRSLFRKDGKQYPADDLASFTLGSVNVSPMSMAAAYATVAARGIYCHPIAIESIVTASGRQLPVESGRCHRVFSAAVADAANYILRGVLTNGTATGDGISVPAAAKTGTANAAYYVAFAGYTPRLVGYVSMFNPKGPITYPMQGTPNSCYRLSPINGGGAFCAGFMFGKNAGEIWQYTFYHADLGNPTAYFVPVPPGSPFLALGSGNVAPQKPKPRKKPGPPPKKPPKKHP